MDNVLITGCSSGIGRATAVKFHEEGWRVHASSRDTDDIDDLKEMGMDTHQLDVTNEEEIESVIDDIIDSDGSLYCLVNNAGYGEFGALEEIDPDSVRSQFEVNVFGALRLIQKVVPYMRENGEGKIINISSVAGRVTTPV